MEEEKVSITGLLSVVYKNKITVLIITAIFLILGILIYIVNPREYTSSATLMPTSGGNGSTSQLSSLASLAGINLGNMGNSGEINAASFEDILRSTPFLTRMVSNTYYFPSVGEKMSLKEYLAQHTARTIFESIGRWPEKLASIFRSRPSKGIPEEEPVVNKDSTTEQDPKENLFFANKVMKVDGSTRKAIKIFSDNLNYTLDIRTGLIRLNLSLQDKAVVAKALKDLIDEFALYIAHYEKKLNKLSLESVTSQLESAQHSYKESLLSLAHFRDRNQDVVLSSAMIQGQQLQEQLALAQSVYTSLQQQRERLQIQIADSTSHIQVVEPPLAQTSPSKPRFILTVLIALFLGIFLGSTYVLSKKSVIQIVGSNKTDRKEIKAEKDEQEVDNDNHTNL